MSIHLKPEQFAKTERISPMLDRFMAERAKHFGEIDLADPGADRLTTDQKILRDKSGHTNTGGNTIYGATRFDGESEEEKKKEEKRRTAQAWGNFSANIKDLEESYSLAAGALKLTEQYNAHAIGMLPGAQKAAAEAEAEAQKKFDEVKDVPITARDKNGKEITVTLNRYGQYVGADGKVLDDQNITVENEEFKDADAAIEQEQVKGHVANIRAFQVSEIESMRKWEEDQRKELEAAKRQADPNNVQSNIQLGKHFGDAAQGFVPQEQTAVFTPKPQHTPAISMGM